MSPSSTVGGYLLSLAKISDASSHTSHVCHTDFLPFPRKADTTSQPVELWENRIPLVLSGPRATAKSCTGIHLKLRPCPNAIFSYSRPRACKTGRQLTAITRTSVSHALTMMTLLPSAAACLACTKIRVSASSWLQGATPSRLIARLLTTSCSLVAMTTFAVNISTILSARKIKSSVLLSFSLKKFGQFDGIFPLLVTLRLAPLSRFDLVSAFRLDGW